MKRLVFLIAPFLAVILLFSNGCAGRQPHPVLIVQKGDEKKSCEEVDSELKAIRSEVGERYPEIEGTEKHRVFVDI